MPFSLNEYVSGGKRPSLLTARSSWERKKKRKVIAGRQASLKKAAGRVAKGPSRCSVPGLTTMLKRHKLKLEDWRRGGGMWYKSGI